MPIHWCALVTAALALISVSTTAAFTGSSLGPFGAAAGFRGGSSIGYSRYPNAFGSQYPFGSGYARRRFGAGGYYPNGGCPICDSSVFSYCSHKLVHDSCCCGDAYYTENSFECQYTDCSYLHANSCQESDLISNCCCEDPYKSYNPLYNRFFKK